MCQLIKTNVDIEIVIRFIEKSIAQEKTIMQTHQVLNNDTEYIAIDYEITQVERLLCFLRRCA